MSHGLRTALIAAALACAACQSIDYRPSVAIGVSPEKLPLRIAVRDLEDRSPAADRGRGFGGTSATAPDSITGSVSTAVTDAVLASFRNDALFTEIRRSPDQTDLVMSGTLRRFSGKSYLHPLGMLPAALFFPPLLGVPIYKSEVEVDLEITFARPDGERVAAYSAARSVDEWGTIYPMPMFGIGTRLNTELTACVADIRRQLLADRERLVSAAQSAAAK